MITPVVSIIYRWFEGSVPPPDYYQYEIELRRNGYGTLSYMPDYPSEHTPTWQQVFQLPAAQRSEFFNWLDTHDIATELIRLQEEEIVGGSQHQFEIHGIHNQIQRSTTFYQGSQTLTALIHHINRIVPQNTWLEMQARQQLYIAEF